MRLTRLLTATAILMALAVPAVAQVVIPESRPAQSSENPWTQIPIVTIPDDKPDVPDKNPWAPQASRATFGVHPV